MRSKRAPLRVLFVSHTAELNGAERMLLQTLTGLDRKKVFPLLAVPRSGPLADEAARTGAPVFVVRSKWWLSGRNGVWKQPAAWLWNIPSVLRLRSLVRREGVDLVFSNSSANFGGALAARLADVPHVWSIHEILGGPRRLLSFLLGSRMLVWAIESLSQAVIVNSEATAAPFGRSSRIRRVPNGIDLRSAAGRRDDRLRRRLGFEKKHKVVGVVGKITPGKGQREAILALAGLSARRPDVRLLCVGVVGDPRYFASLRELVRRRGLESRVVFSGYVADIFSYIRLMDLLLITSRSESFGRTAVEAMAAGVPVLAVAVGGLTEIISSGRTGFLAESSEPGLLVPEIERLLARPAALAAVVRRGRAEVRRRYGLAPVVSRVERILLECGRSRRGSHA
jgi:glycosyltransferase involved in cell wall biosynthesis